MGNFCSSPLGQIDAGKEIILIEKAQGADSQVIPSDGGNSILLLACRDVPGTAAFALAAHTNGLTDGTGRGEHEATSAAATVERDGRWHEHRAQRPACMHTLRAQCCNLASARTTSTSGGGSGSLRISPFEHGRILEHVGENEESHLRGSSWPKVAHK